MPKPGDGRMMVPPGRDTVKPRCRLLPCCRKGAGVPTGRCSSCCGAVGTQRRLGTAHWKMLRRSRQMQADCTQKEAEEGLRAEGAGDTQGLLCWSVLLQLEHLKIPSQPKKQKEQDTNDESCCQLLSKDILSSPLVTPAEFDRKSSLVHRL